MTKFILIALGALTLAACQPGDGYGTNSYSASTYAAGDSGGNGY